MERARTDRDGARRSGDAIRRRPVVLLRESLRFGCAVCILVCAAGEARADGAPPGPIRFEASVRTGAGLTFVSVTNSQLPGSTSVDLPVGVDVGLRIDNRWFVGAFL